MGDLLAVLVVKILTNDFAIRVSAISVIARTLFETATPCRGPPLSAAGYSSTSLPGDCSSSTAPRSTALRTPMLVIPLQSSILRLRAALLTEVDRDTQGSLPFPPTPTTRAASDEAMEAQA